MLALCQQALPSALAEFAGIHDECIADLEYFAPLQCWLEPQNKG
jgi:hypothetical protein